MTGVQTCALPIWGGLRFGICIPSRRATGNKEDAGESQGHGFEVPGRFHRFVAPGWGRAEIGISFEFGKTKVRPRLASRILMEFG